MRQHDRIIKSNAAWLFTLIGITVIAQPAHARQRSPVRIGDAITFGYWAPQIHEMYVCLPLEADLTDAGQTLERGPIKVNGREPVFVYWYIDGVPAAYGNITRAHEQKVDLYIPLAWQAGQTYRIEIECTYNGRSGTVRRNISAPESGGAWDRARAGNQAFMVREEAGLDRANEPVEFDVTVPRSVFPKAAQRVRATVMTEPGVFETIPCQIYAVERFRIQGGMTPFRQPETFVRFRACVQLSIKAHEQKLVHLWELRGKVDKEKEANTDAAIEFTGEPTGGSVETARYLIELHDPSGQILNWRDKQLQHTFEYSDYGKRRNLHVINRTPDVFVHPKDWSHAFDWNVGPDDRCESQVTTGPVFCETVRWGPMAWTPQVHGRATYRFYPNRPEVRVSSVMRVLEEMMALGFRNGNITMSPDMFSHAAWSQQDGTVVRRSIADSRGNDTGGRPESRFAIDAPWYALYDREKKIGFAVLNIKRAQFNELGGPVNTTRQQAYVSLYGGKLIYMIRCANQTWNASTRTYPTPMHVGETLYEDVALLPFSFDAEDEHQFDQVAELLKRLRQPLVVAP